jgi:hypothetical protein
MTPEDQPPKRTIDERLDGLTQTLEIIAAMQRDNERRFAENALRFAEVAAIQSATQTQFSDINTALTALLTVTQSHEKRLSKLEQ